MLESSSRHVWQHQTHEKLHDDYALTPKDWKWWWIDTVRKIFRDKDLCCMKKAWMADSNIKLLHVKGKKALWVGQILHVTDTAS